MLLPSAFKDKYGHTTRFSDSSFYDEVCNKCGATDSGSRLNESCPFPDLPIEEWRYASQGEKEYYLNKLNEEQTEVIPFGQKT